MHTEILFKRHASFTAVMLLSASLCCTTANAALKNGDASTGTSQAAAASKPATDEDDCVVDPAPAPAVISTVTPQSARTAPGNKSQPIYSAAPADAKNTPHWEDLSTSAAGLKQATSLSAADTRSSASSVVAVNEQIKPITAWTIVPSDKTLNAALSRWATAAGWQLVWEVQVDYAVDTQASIVGTFDEAVEKVTKSMDTAEIPLKAIFYKGNHVLRIVAKGAQ